MKTKNQRKGLVEKRKTSNSGVTAAKRPSGKKKTLSPAQSNSEEIEENSVPNYEDFLSNFNSDESDSEDMSPRKGQIEAKKVPGVDPTTSSFDDNSDLDMSEEDGDSSHDDEVFDKEKEKKNVAAGKRQTDNPLDINGENQNESDLSSSDEDLDPEQHKKALQKLSQTDPDFFEFLKENDADLLNFDDSDNDDEDDSDASDIDQLHKPSEVLEEASDSEAEEEKIDVTVEGYDDKVKKLIKRRVVNLDVIKDWETKLEKTKDIQVFTHIVEALECAIDQILNPDVEMKHQGWKIKGSTNFNALLRLCLNKVHGFCARLLTGSNNERIAIEKINDKPFDVKEKASKKWNRLKPKLRLYMNCLLQYLKAVSNSDAVAAVLRHCKKMSPFWALMTTKITKFLRKLITIWSEGEDFCRVIAFVTILKITNYNWEVFLVQNCKLMFMAYVSNCKFTSVNSWPAINFMRRCLVEILLLDENTAYSIAFPFIRQLAIHLRNALSPEATVKSNAKSSKKDAARIVYSWQWVHSYYLWGDLVSHPASLKSKNLNLLLSPVVQTGLGAIRLIPTKKYIPLRFLIVRILINIQDSTKTFIPVLPIVTEALTLTDFSPKAIGKFSVRPLDLTCCLRADPAESGFARAVLDTTFELIVRACRAICCELSFPEVVFIATSHLKRFLKKQCKDPEVCKKYRQLLEKIEANSKYINERRNKALDAGNFNLADEETIKTLQVQMETCEPHPPMMAYANNCLKVHEITQAKLRKSDHLTREEKLIPRPVSATQKKLKEKIQADIFDSDSDGEVEFTTKLDNTSQLESTPEDTMGKRDKTKPKKGKRKVLAEDTPLSEKKKSRVDVASADVPDEIVDFELSSDDED